MLIRFPDEFYILAANNIQYRQASIKPSEPILSPKYHWEIPRTNMYGSVLKTARGYEMYYQCGNALRIGYAFSSDGLEWHRPLINPTDFTADSHKIIQTENSATSLIADLLESDDLEEGVELTNLVAGYHMPSILYDATCFDSGSSEAYKIFAFGEEGYCTLHSSNGTQFKTDSDQPVIRLLAYKNEFTEKTWCSDVAPCFKDKQAYTAMVKTYIVDDEERTRRCIGRSTSDDFKEWSEVETIWEPGAAEDIIAQARGYHWADFYGLCPFPYGQGYLGFLWLFEIEKELPRGTNLGKIEVFLAYSPDGKQWRRIEDKPFIPWDLNFGAEGGMVTTPGAPIFEDNEIKLYYSDCNFEHGYAEKDFTKPVSEPTWVVRCARLAKERLVGAYSSNGSLEFNTMDFQEGKIRLNVNCLKGSLTLQYKLPGQVVKEETLKNIDETDFVLNVPVKGNADLSVTLNNATLYAIEVL